MRNVPSAFRSDASWAIALFAIVTVVPCWAQVASPPAPNLDAAVQEGPGEGDEGESESIDEAVEMIHNYNVHFVDTEGHLMVTDAAGHSRIVESIGGKIRVVASDGPWQVCTNHIAWNRSERARDLRRFVDLSNSQLAALVQEMRTKLRNIANQGRHIEEMLPDMKKLTHLKQSPDEVRLVELLDDAIALIPSNLCDTLSVVVEPGVEKIDRIRTHRLSLLHVLANILVNAAESMGGAGLRSGQVRIEADFEQVGGMRMAHLRICDNGPGIEPDVLGRIFERDFTTKKGGSSGIGLHWCANILRAMNGRLYAESKGAGHGACFHVLLPANQ